MKAVEKRRMCPNCRAFISISDRVCPYCGVNVGPRAIDLRASQFTASLLPRANLSSLIILVINIAFFLVELIVNYRIFNASPENLRIEVAVILGAKYGPLIHAGQYWRLITAGFLHGRFIHIAMNSWALFDLVGEVVLGFLRPLWDDLVVGRSSIGDWPPGGPPQGSAANSPGWPCT